MSDSSELSLKVGEALVRVKLYSPWDGAAEQAAQEVSRIYQQREAIKKSLAKMLATLDKPMGKRQIAALQRQLTRMRQELN